MLQVSKSTFGKIYRRGQKIFRQTLPQALSPNSKIAKNLLIHFLISAAHYELLFNNFLSLVCTLDEVVSGDEKLLHFTGNSEHIIAVKAKPARVGLWFYQLVGFLKNGLTYELHRMIMRVVTKPLLWMRSWGGGKCYWRFSFALPSCFRHISLLQRVVGRDVWFFQRKSKQTRPVGGTVPCRQQCNMIVIQISRWWRQFWVIMLR